MNRIFKILALAAAITVTAAPAFAADSAMTHIALSETGGAVTWLEEVNSSDYPNK